MAQSYPVIFVRQGSKSKRVPYRQYYRRMQEIFASAAEEATQAYDPDATFQKATQRGIQNWGKDVLSGHSGTRRSRRIRASS